jgi:uncharacterized membrane protein
MIDHKRDGTALATGLGWFSIGLGAAELLAPGMLAKLIGTSDSSRARKTLRIFGAREILAGAMILAGPRRSLPLWMRVAGDGIDLAALLFAMRSQDANRTRLLASAASVAGVTALDVVTGVLNARKQSSAREAVIETITVYRPPADVYAAWRDFEQFPRFMNWLESVRDLGNGLTEWTAKLPVGGTTTWTAVTTEDRPGQRISWRTIENAKVPSHGTVLFKPTLDGMATEIEVEMQYDVPGSRALGALFAKLATREQVNGDLKRFKQVLETGEVVQSDSSIHVGPHPARPSSSTGSGNGHQKGAAL